MHTIASLGCTHSKSIYPQFRNPFGSRAAPGKSNGSCGQECYCQLSLIFQLCPILNKKDLAWLPMTWTCSFSNVLYVGLHWKTTWKFNWSRIQQLGCLTGIARYNHVTPVLQEITLAISGFLNLIQSAGITFKALYGLGLGFLKDRFMIQVPVCSLHSFGEGLLQILSSTQAQVVVTKKRALPSPWLPDSWHWKSLPMGV